MQVELKTTSCSETAAGPAVSVDVLFVGDRPVSAELAEHLNERRYLWDIVPLSDLDKYVERHSCCVCIVVDCGNVSAVQERAFRKLIEQLDAQNTSVICYGGARTFSLQHLNLAAQTDSIGFEELWARIDSHVRLGKQIRQRSAAATPNEHAGQLSGDTAQQLEMAGRVQRNFLPSRLPHTDRIHWAALFRPAEWVSGDIYDIARLDEDHIGFYLADAVGHSVPAALLTMFLKQATVMRQTVGERYFIYKPADVIKNLNLRMIEQELNGCLFATCFYGLLNIRTLQLDYARAGHPYPVLIRDNRLVSLQTRGGLLGVFESSEFEQHTLQLQPGDKLFVYSDGGESLIGETQENGSLEFFERFSQMCRLPIEEMLKTFGQCAAEHRFAPELVDDVTAIGLQVIA